MDADLDMSYNILKKILEYEKSVYIISSTSIFLFVR